MKENNIGIYLIECLKTNKVYIGSAKNLERRKKEHFLNLLKNKHNNKFLQNAWNKYGSENFIFKVLEKVNNENELLFHEQKFIDAFKKTHKLFNICMIAGNTLGIKMSDEAKRKLSISATGRRKTTEQILEQSKRMMGIKNPMFGKNHSNDTKLLIKYNRGNIQAENNPHSKLSWVEVREIREKYKMKQKTQKKLGIEYGVTEATIAHILNNRTWIEYEQQPEPV
jgi:group I intron endonuclease